MAKDSLARGARSATFSAGQAEKDAPIEFHGTVAEEDETKHSDGSSTFHCGICGDGPEPCRHALRVVEPIAPAKTLEELAAKYQPMNDRVLLRRIEEKNEHLVNLPDAFVQDSDMGEVIAVGDGMLIGGELRPINLKAGDKVRFGHYNAEDIEVEGVKVTLVSAFDVRLKIRS